MLIVLGLILVGVGLLFTYAGRLPLKLGKLPGDISIRRENFTFYFPLGTSILLSILVSVVLWLINRK